MTPIDSYAIGKELIMSTVFRRVFIGAVVGLLPCGLIGCGGGKDVALVRGTVTCNGNALPGGSIHFLPGVLDMTGKRDVSGKIPMYRKDTVAVVSERSMG